MVRAVSAWRRGPGSNSWETAAGVVAWDKAPAPAQAAKKMADLAGVELPPTSVRAVTNLMHWAYGSVWGGLAGAIEQKGIRPGLLLGVGVWGFSYISLPVLGVYKPIWEYDTETLWKDLSAHLLYGAVTGAVAEALAD